MKKLLILIPLLTSFSFAQAEEMTFQVEDSEKKELDAKVETKIEPKAKADTKSKEATSLKEDATKAKVKTEKKSATKGKEPVELLKDFLKSTKTLTSNFKQVVLNKKGKVKQKSSGLFYLSRPGKFRWHYKKPFVQEIVSSSGKVWFYDADLEQVTIKKLNKSMGATPALLLSGKGNIEKQYNLKAQGDSEGLKWVKLMPKNKGSSFEYVLIGLNKGVLGGMELSDNFGQLTRIYFSNVKINPPLKKSEFTFIIPKGADVFEDNGGKK